MSYAAIAYITPQYEDFANNWLKAYEPATTTAKLMSHDGGSTTAAKYELDSQGFPITSGNVRIIPYIDGAYDLWLFATEADADANTTGNAIQVADDITAPSVAGSGSTSINELTTATMTANTNKAYEVGDVIQTKEYSTGNGGGGTYDCATVGTTVNVDLPDEVNILVSTVDGTKCFALRHGVTINFKSLGGIGDDSTDNTGVFNVAKTLTPPIDFGGPENIYRTDEIDFAAPFDFFGQGATIKLITNQTKLLDIDTSDFSLNGLIFDGRSLEVNQNLVFIHDSLTGWLMNNCTFQNITGVTGVDQYALKVGGDDAEGQLLNLSFKNISNFNVSQAPTSAFNGGIVVLDSVTGPKQLIIKNIYCDNIWTDNIAADIDNSDSDGIRIVGTSALQSGISIDGLYCTGVQKSGLKVSGCKGAQFSNIYIEGTRTDIPMVAGARWQASDDSICTNVKVKGNVFRAVNLRTSNFVLSGVNYSPLLSTDTPSSSLIAIQATDAAISENIVISDITATAVTRFLNLDTSGLTVDVGFNNISINNAVIQHHATSSLGSSRIRRCKNVQLNNVQCFDSEDNLATAWEFERGSEIYFNHVYSEFRRNATVFTSGSLGVTGVYFNHCKFVRPDSETGDTSFKSLTLEYSDGTSMTNVNLNDVQVSVPSYASTSNQTIVLCGLIESSISNLEMEIRDVGVANPGTAVLGTFVDCKIDPPLPI